MRAWRVLSTGAVAVAIGGCAVTVVAFASTQPKGKPDKPAALPTSSTVDVTIAAGPPPSSSSPPVRRTPATTHPRTAPSTRPPSSSTHPATHAPTRPSTKAAPPPPPKPKPKPRGQSLPLAYNTGLATRVITVVASSTGSTTATLQAWTKAAGGGWLRYGSAVTAHVGSQGLTTHPSESKSATPIGSFTLTQAFGALANPGTGLPYFETDAADWWISQSGSLYNTHQHCSSGCSFNTSSNSNSNPNEHLRYETPFYNYAVVIDYNRFPVHQGAGSAFFLHVTDGSATAGCVAISQSKLVSLMKWLAPSTRPRMLIGVA
ncbi:MAG TPA: L,D-transpeptidase family protein [Jatrophihabitantaceae bacterium]|jgi:L,D-peptidoglycan transpeptidase YkuD (ErfK/YbiS/YcfS/YnhG family)